MLQSFTGTFDAVGLRSLREEEDKTERREVPSDRVPFWAILDSKEVPTIHAALMLGCRDTAFELLTQRAKAFGRLCE